MTREAMKKQSLQKPSSPFGACLGFSLIELMLVLALIAGMSALAVTKLRREAEMSEAKVAGVDLAYASEAMTLYMKAHASALQTMTDPNCLPSGVADVCRLNLAILAQEGLMSAGWQPYNAAARSDYSGYVRRVPPVSGATVASDYNLESLLMTDLPWTSGGVGVSVLALNTAARAAGAIAGITRAGTAVGLSEGWTMAAGRYPNMGDGQLVASAVAHTQAMGTYLPLDGSRAMKGELALNAYRLNNAQDITLNGNGMKNQKVSDLMPNWVLKGVYGVSDYDADNAGGTVPIPICPDSAGGAGTARVLVSMQSLYNEQFGGYVSGVAGNTPADAIMSLNGAFGAWNFYALEDSGSGVWRTYIRRFYDNGYIPGEGMAAVYCYYP